MGRLLKSHKLGTLSQVRRLHAYVVWRNGATLHFWIITIMRIFQLFLLHFKDIWKIANLRQSSNSICLHYWQETTFVCTTTNDNFLHTTAIDNFLCTTAIVNFGLHCCKMVKLVANIQSINILTSRAAIAAKKTSKFLLTL